MARKKRLVPGATATIYRRGGGFSDALGQHVVPDDGSNLQVRFLPPGAYTARDTAGGECEFEVDGHAEVTHIPVKGGEDLAPAPNDDPNPHPKEAPRLHGGRSAVPNLPHVPDPDAGELEGELRKLDESEGDEKPAAAPAAKKAPAKQHGKTTKQPGSK